MASRSQLSLRCFVVVSFLLLVVAVVDAKDLYKVLGVDKNASVRDIKKAFHKQSLKYHPDKNKAKNAQSKFEEISHAYEILSDAEKRKLYDLTGDEKGQGFGGFQDFGGQYSDRQYDSGSPFFEAGGPGGRTFTFTFGGPGGGANQGFSQFFSNSQSQRQARQKQSAKKESREQPSWASNMYNSFMNEESFSFGDFGGGIFNNLFSSFGDGFGQAKEPENNAKKTTPDLPKEVEKLSPSQFKTQVLGTRKASWAVLYYLSDKPGIGDRLKVLASFAKEMKGVIKVGAVDCKSQREFCKEQGVRSVPKVLIYPLRAEAKSKPVAYTGDWTVKALKNFYNQQFS